MSFIPVSCNTAPTIQLVFYNMEDVRTTYQSLPKGASTAVTYFNDVILKQQNILHQSQAVFQQNIGYRDTYDKTRIDVLFSAEKLPLNC